MAFTKGDTVRVGKGKVEYTVLDAVKDGTQGVESHNTGKVTLVDPARLVLVKAAEDIERDAKPETDGPLVPGVQPNPVPVMVDPVEAEKVLTGTVVATVPERSNYSKAILGGLQAKGVHIFEGLSLTPKARAKRKAARRAAKISRKANR